MTERDEYPSLSESDLTGEGTSSEKNTPDEGMTVEKIERIASECPSLEDISFDQIFEAYLDMFPDSTREDLANDVLKSGEGQVEESDEDDAEIVVEIGLNIWARSLGLLF